MRSACSLRMVGWALGVKLFRRGFEGDVLRLNVCGRERAAGQDERFSQRSHFVRFETPPITVRNSHQPEHDSLKEGL
jgi:hypothetical protein